LHPARRALLFHARLALEFVENGTSDSRFAIAIKKVVARANGSQLRESDVF
jgi:hypothetical protein